MTLSVSLRLLEYSSLSKATFRVPFISETNRSMSLWSSTPFPAGSFRALGLFGSLKL